MKIGDRVIPISKSTGCDLKDSPCWKRAKSKGQPYLYVKDVNTGNRYILDEDTLSPGGDYYLREDLVRYEEDRIDAKSYWNAVIRRRTESGL